MHQSIIKTLRKDSFFTEHDFSIHSESGNKGVILTIKCNFDNSYYFQVTISSNREEYKPGNQEYILRGQRCPGSLSILENVTYIGKAKLLDGIYEWVMSIKEELLAIPTYRKIEDQKKEISKLEAWIKTVPDDYFSQAEAKDLKERLNALEELFTQRVTQEVATKQELEQEIKKIQEELEILRSQVDILKQPKWWGALFGRLMNWTADPDNRKLISSTAEVAKLLLPDGKEAASTRAE